MNILLGPNESAEIPWFDPETGERCIIAIARREGGRLIIEPASGWRSELAEDEEDALDFFRTEEPVEAAV